MRAPARLALLLPAMLSARLARSAHAHAAGARAARPSRHARPLFFYNDVYRFDLPDAHRFPMDKYEAVRVSLQRELGDAAEFVESPLATMAELTTTHTTDYVSRFVNDQLTDMEHRRIGFPRGRQGVDRALSSTGGTVAATRAVLGSASRRVSGHIAGGTHHAFADRGEGFCVFSDIAVAANCALAEEPGLSRILVVDLDVHQGNGNAVLFASEPRVFTFSVQCSANYFSPRESSDLDIEVAPGTGDREYMATLRDTLPPLFRRTRPQLVFFQAGVDCLANDRFGKLRLTRAGLRARNNLVYSLCARHGAPVVVTMGGGYPRDMSPGSADAFAVVQAHMDVYRCARQAAERLSWSRAAADTVDGHGSALPAVLGGSRGGPGQAGTSSVVESDGNDQANLQHQTSQTTNKSS